MLSELIIACTLLVNACAILNFKLKPGGGNQLGFIDPDAKSVGESAGSAVYS
jgi:hypothetical protein